MLILICSGGGGNYSITPLGSVPFTTAPFLHKFYTVLWTFFEFDLHTKRV